MEKFETNEEVIYALIIDDLDETIAPENKLVLEHWRNASLENEKTYQDFLNIQVNLDKLSEEHGYSIQDSWNALDHKLLSRADSRKTINFKLWISLAASILLICSLGYYFLAYPDYQLITTDENAKTIALPDGTVVNLNASTSIKYSRRYFEQDRKLELLKGEAFVKVIKHIGSQFHVVLGDVDARDIGTSFNLQKTDRNIKVIVEEGKVSMTHVDSGEEIMLVSGKIGIYDLNTKVLHATDNPDTNYKAWLDKKFVFKNSPLPEVISQLERVYQTSISIDGSGLKERKLTANLHYEKLDSVLAVISASLQCKTTKLKDTYILSDN
jgi:transmembrane sensor